MTTAFWNSAVSDDWINAADWTPGLPNPKRDAVINANGIYTVTVSSADKAHSLTIDDAGATLSENSGGSLTMAGGLTLDAGTAILNGVNSFHGNTRLIGGTLELGNAAALGNSNLAIDGGALVGVANVTFSNQVAASGTFTLAAGHGDTFKFAGQTVLNMNGGGNIEFGQSGDDGVFLWDPATLGVANGGAGFSVDVNAGTLRDGNGSLNEVLSAANSVSIAAGAKLDVHGNAETMRNLSGAGTITSSINGGALIIDGGTFSGNITGALALTVANSLMLTGTYTYTGGTIIDSGATLSLQNKGTTVFSSAISGGGSIVQNSGTAVLSGANTYSGGTTLNGGILKIGDAAALGTGELLTSGGELLGTVTGILSNQLAIHGTTTFAAASGTTLTLDSADAWTIGPNVDIVFGSSGSDGAIVWDSPVGSSVDHTPHGITIADGTLEAGDGNFQALLTAASYLDGTSGHLIYGFTYIARDAALDVAGFANTIYSLRGSGTIENSGPVTTVTLANSHFQGQLSGNIVLDIDGRTTLGGGAADWGTINLLSGAELTLAGASSSDIVFSTGSPNLLVLGEFAGSLIGFRSQDRMEIPGLGKSNLTISYSGDTTGGTLTASNGSNSVNVAMVGDYTKGTFSIVPFNKGNNIIFFNPNPQAASTHVNAFDFSAAPAPHAVTDAGIASLNGGHSANEITFAHDVTEAMHPHGFMFDHFTHQLFAHAHMGMAEAPL